MEEKRGGRDMNISLFLNKLPTINGSCEKY
jgi:hypothetical protein